MEDAMPIMAIYRASGVDQATYDRFRLEVPIEPMPDGAIGHLVAFDGNGVIGIDIWESEAQMEAFARDKLNPGLRRLGRSMEPPQVQGLYELYIARGAERHNVTAAAPQPA
jgi:hypothetical protein